MSEITADVIKQALKPADAKQYLNLRKKISEGKVLSAYEQKKYDEYEARIEAYLAKTDNKNPYVMPSSAVAQFYGKSPVALHKWKSLAGYPKHAHISHGLIDLKILNDWVVNYFYGNAITATSMAEAKLRREIAKARRDELITQELEGKLIPEEKVIEDLIFLLSILKQRILSWVKRIPPVVKMKDEKQIIKILSDETKLILTELSEGTKKLCKKQKA